MRIGIITICKVNNYGAELQAFATQKKLEQMGYDVEIIDYLYYKNWHFKDSVLSRPFIPMNIKKKIIYWIKYRLMSWMVDQIFPIFSGNARRRTLNYQSFIKKGNYSSQYKSIDELYKANLNYDIYMVGSDQVWNPLASSSIEPYFLTFAPKNAKKIAYASSFGVSELNNNLQNRYAYLLKNLDFISVREQSGVDLVKQLTGKDAKLVCDPTLLLSKQDWKPYMKPYPNMPKKYVAIYQLSDSDTIVNLALRISKEQHIPVYRICKTPFRTKRHKGISNILDAGPSEFLSLIINASFIVTDSFHGTAFSINFGVPFYTVVSTLKKNNSRMVSLLNYVQLTDRLVKDDAHIQNIIIDHYDNNKVQQLLYTFRNSSVSFLSSILN